MGPILNLDLVYVLLRHELVPLDFHLIHHLYLLTYGTPRRKQVFINGSGNYLLGNFIFDY